MGPCYDNDHSGQLPLPHLGYIMLTTDNTAILIEQKEKARAIKVKFTMEERTV